MYPRIKQEIKDQILARIKNDGVNANRAANDAGVSPKTVYGWLAQEARNGNPNILEINRLRRENEGLYQIIGKLTSEIEKQKKGKLPR
jgi:transposase-like protein